MTPEFDDGPAGSGLEEGLTEADMLLPVRKRRGRKKKAPAGPLFGAKMEETSVEEVPINRLIFKILRLLQQVQRAMSAQEIHTEIGINIITHPSLFHELTQNPKVFTHPNYHFSYQPMYNIKSKEDLYQEIVNHPNGILKADIDEYPRANDDVRELELERKIFIIQMKDRHYLFPNPPAFHNLKMEREFQEKWAKIKPPSWMSDRELDDYINKNLSDTSAPPSKRGRLL